MGAIVSQKSPGLSLASSVEMLNLSCPAPPPGYPCLFPQGGCLPAAGAGLSFWNQAAGKSTDVWMYFRQQSAGAGNRKEEHLGQDRATALPSTWGRERGLV